MSYERFGRGCFLARAIFAGVNEKWIQVPKR